MGMLSIQIQPDLMADFSETLVSDLSQDLPVSHVDVQRGFDKGHYINVNLSTNSTPDVWKVVRERLFRLGLQRASIVTSTESNDWAEYEILHHFDRTQVDKPRQR